MSDPPCDNKTKKIMKNLYIRSWLYGHRLRTRPFAIAPVPTCPRIPRCRLSDSDQFRVIPSNSDHRKVKTTEKPFLGRNTKIMSRTDTKKIMDAEITTANRK